MKTQEFLKEAMQIRSTNPTRANVLREIVAQAREIAKNDGNREANDADVALSITKLIKTNQNAISQGVTQGFPTDKFVDELNILQEFAPPVMSEENMILAIWDQINKLAPEQRTIKSMGVVMAELKKIEGMDTRFASTKVKELLN
jgi:uncharacterized protein YqeY